MFVRVKSPLLPFKLHRFKFGEEERFFILLPKLCTQQVNIITQRLTGTGFAVSHPKSLRAVKGSVTINLDPMGLCWSNEDVTDVIAPIIPRMLMVQKQVTPLRDLRNHYFDLKRIREGYVVRFSSRMESSRLWENLRATDQCALTPDEHFVFRALFNYASGAVRLLTDYPTNNSAVKRMGRRQYYESEVTTSEAASNLRMVGPRGTRNTYLPKDGLIRFQGMRLPSTYEMTKLFEDLGGWCFLTPLRQQETVS